MNKTEEINSMIPDKVTKDNCRWYIYAYLLPRFENWRRSGRLGYTYNKDLDFNDSNYFYIGDLDDKGQPFGWGKAFCSGIGSIVGTFKDGKPHGIIRRSYAGKRTDEDRSKELIEVQEFYRGRRHGRGTDYKTVN